MKSIRTKYFLAFNIPVILLILIYLFLGIVPFGSKTIMSGDLLGQYVAINNYIRNNIIGITSLSELRNLLFSTSAGLGINFFPVLTYYAFSPLNLISLFFSRGTMPLFFELNIILDTGILGLASYIFFVKSSFVRLKHNSSAIIGSTLFALSSYMIVYGQCLMWFNSIILFPLILLGYERLLNGKINFYYYGLLTLAIISNYYIGLMIVIFLFYVSAFWILYNVKDLLAIGKSCINAIILTIGAIGTSSFVILPSYLAQKNVHQERFALGLGKIYPYKDIVKAFIINANSNIPLLFCSICVPLLVFCYFLNKKIKAKERVTVGLFLSFLLVSTNVSALYMIWHLFTLPNGFVERESFMVCFVMIMLAVKELDYTNIHYIYLTIVGIAWILLLLVEVRTHNLSLKLFMLNSILILIYVLLFTIYRENTYRNNIVFTFICLECIMSGFVLNRNINFAKIGPFYSVNTSESSAIDKIKKRDTGIYRMGSTFQINTNDPLNYNFMGNSGYLSQLSTNETDYLSYLGYYQKHSWFRWAQYNNGSTKAIDSLLGIKYVLSSSRMNKLTQKINSFPTFNNVALDQSKRIASVNDIELFKNRTAFPFVFSTKAVKLNAKYAPDKNPFESYNNLFRGVGVNHLYEPVLGSNGTEISFGKKSIISSELDNTGLVYAYVASSKSNILDNINFYVKGQHIKYAGDNANGENGIVCLGRYKVGDNLRVRIDSENRQKHKIYIYQENSDLLSIAAKNAGSQSQNIKNTVLRGNLLTFRTTAKYQGGDMAIPIFYQDGWHLFIDGQEQSQKIRSCFGGLMATKIPHGQHTVRLVYHVPGLRGSVLVSLIILLIMVFYIYLGLKRQKSK